MSTQYFAISSGQYNTTYHIVDELSTAEAVNLAKGYHCDFDSVVFYEVPEGYLDTIDNAPYSYCGEWEDESTEDKIHFLGDFSDWRHTFNVLYTGLNCDTGLLEVDGEWYDSYAYTSIDEARKAGEVYDSEVEALKDITLQDPTGMALDFE